MDKRAKLEISDVIPVGLVIIVAGIMLSLGAEVGNDISNDVAVCGANSSYTYQESTQLCVYNTTSNETPTGYAWDASRSSLEGLWNLADRMPTIGLVAAIVIVIGLLVSGFGYLMTRR